VGIKGLTEPLSDDQAQKLVARAVGRFLEYEDNYREEEDWLDLIVRTARRGRVDWSKVPEVMTDAELTLFDQNPDRDSPLDIMEEE